MVFAGKSECKLQYTNRPFPDSRTYRRREPTVGAPTQRSKVWSLDLNDTLSNIRER